MSIESSYGHTAKPVQSHWTNFVNLDSIVAQQVKLTTTRVGPSKEERLPPDQINLLMGAAKLAFNTQMKSLEQQPESLGVEAAAIVQKLVGQAEQAHKATTVRASSDATL